MTTCHILTRASTQRVPVTVQSANSYLFLKLEWGLPEHTRHHDPAGRISTAFPCCLADRDMLSPEEDLLNANQSEDLYCPGHRAGPDDVGTGNLSLGI